MFKKIKFLSLLIMVGAMVSSQVSAAPLLSPEFLKACKNHDLATVQKLVAREENEPDFDSSAYEFSSPLAAAARFGSKEILSYLICHPKIDVNKNIVEFKKDECLFCSIERFPLFFGLLYNNDYVNLDLLLKNPKFNIEPVRIGLKKIGNRPLGKGWNLSPETRNVLGNSKYFIYFYDIISTYINWELLSNSDEEFSYWEFFSY